MSGSGIRQYDIWIDGRKLSAGFLLDSETRADHRVLLGFDGRVAMLHRSNYRWLKRTVGRRHYAKLGGTAIEFQLKDDASGRRVLITSTSAYLQWAERDGACGDFVSFPNHPEGIQQQLVFGRTYVFQDVAINFSSDSDCFPGGVPTAPTMTLRVTDRLAGLEVDDGRPASPVLDPAESGCGTRMHEQLQAPGLRVLLGRLEGLIH
jgi:hypothetical protein